MRLLSPCIQLNPNNFAKTTTWDSRKLIYTVSLTINVPVAEKEIYTAPQMPTRWGKLPK